MSAEVIGQRFVLERVAGRGGMGVVYRAHDQLTGKPAAVKLLVSDLPDAVRFEREAQVLATVEHPGVVRYLAHGDAGDGRRYLAMEWLEGEDLAARLARGPLTLAETMRVMCAAASALAAVHRLGIVHRDVKPQNLFLVGGRLDELRLLDFGIARRPEAQAAPLTRTGVLMGTPSYMPPEQVRGLKQLDARADVYALGCVMFECLTGQAAFIGEHVMAVLARVLLEECPRLSARLDDVPPALDALLAAVTAKAPEARPADAGRLLEQLMAIPLDARAQVVAGTRLTEREQRLVCVVAAGPAVDTTGTEATLPPETRLQQVADLDRVAARFGAQLEPVPGGAVFVSLVGAAAATDQVSQATRCAVALRELVPAHAFFVATGRALLEEGRVPLGEVVDRAAAGLRVAAAGGICVDSLSAALLDGAFRLAPTASGATVLGERPAGEAEEVRPLLGMATPFVGRERELSVLDALFDECTGDPGARVALVTAPAGFGKTRLRTELVKHLRARGEVELLLGRGDPQRQDTANGLLVSALRRAFSIEDGMAAPLRHARVEERTRRHFSGEALEQTSAFLSELLGDAVPDAGRPWLAAPRRDPRLMAEQVRRAFCEWVEAEARARPLVLVLEDLHWGDQSTVRMIDAALRHAKELPFFVLALARPEVAERFPRLWAERGLQQVALGELRPRAAEQLVRKVMERARLEHVDDAVVQRLVTRAAGNAFYLEELIRQVVDGGDAGQLPDSVVAMAQLRLEGLTVEQRTALRAGSVFGEVFWENAVGALTSVSAAAVLSSLVEAEVLVERPRSRFGNEREFAFRHALLRDAAYAMMTARDRSSGHRLAAGWLERAGDRDFGALAQHYRLGDDLVSAARCDVTAAEAALDRDDLQGAERWAREAEASGATGETWERVLAVRLQLARWQAEDLVRETALRLVDLAQPGAVRWCRAMGDASLATTGASPEEARALRVRFLATDPQRGAEVEYAICGARIAAHHCITRTEGAGEVLARARTFAEGRTESDTALGGALEEAEGFFCGVRADVDASLAHFERARVAFASAQSLRDEAVQTVNIGFNARSLGRLHEFVPRFEHAAALARQHGWVRIEQPLLVLLAEACAEANDREGVLRWSKLLGLQPLVAGASFQRAYHATLWMRLVAAFALTDEARLVLGPPEVLPMLVRFDRSAITRHLAWALLELGELDQACAVVRGALERPPVMTMFDDALHHQEMAWVGARTFFALGLEDQGRAALQQALDAFEAARARLRPASHAAFEAIRSHRSLFELARRHGLR